MGDVALSFRSAKELHARAEMLPAGPQWLCETLVLEYPTKQPPHLFYRNLIECLQALLSHPLFVPHMSFVPRRLWTCATKICRIYDEWLSGDQAWSIQVRPAVVLVWQSQWHLVRRPYHLVRPSWGLSCHLIRLISPLWVETVWPIRF